MSRFIAGKQGRADRLEVDVCADCCFVYLSRDGEAQCRHPRFLTLGLQGPGKFIDETKIDTDVDPDCPIRGSVTMVAGPKRETT